MKSIPKLIRRFFAVLLLSVFLSLVLNLVLFFIVSAQQAGSGGAWSTAESVAASLSKTDMQYRLTADAQKQLQDKGAWAILIDKGSMRVTWHSSNLPPEIPLQYDINDVSYLSRAYLKDYPTTTSAHPDGLIVLGYPKTSYWKLISNTFDYQLIAHMPQTILLFLAANIFLIFIIYMAVSTKLLHSVKPIVNGVERLPDEKDVYLPETGLLSEISQAINRTSAKLKTQDYALKKQETARANWIAGVSHDIRTPLSMVMGYAGQLEACEELSEENRKKAAVIRQQSIRMKNLINDLNLASKLEYNMQPVHREPVNLIPLVRQAAVDFLNLDMDGRYPVAWDTPDALTSCLVEGDRALLRRAVSNLISNAQLHNPDGCRIRIAVENRADTFAVAVQDNGVGISEEQLEKLKNMPHYMVCDSNTTEQRHGLGLMIVRQIVKAHHGTVDIEHSPEGGFSVTLFLPKLPCQP